MADARRRRAAAVAAAVLAVTGCSLRPSPPPAAPPPAAALALDPARTEVLVRVYREGPLAAVGHNHVITATAVEGSVTPAAGGEYAFALRLPVAAFVVDDPAARARAGADFAAPVDDAARAGTRGNLLGPRLLDAERFPAIGLAGRSVTGPDGTRSLDIAITVRDVTRPFRIPVTVEAAPDGPRLRGALRVTHAELGLEPFSVMGGMLRVRDELGIEFVAGLGAGGVSAAGAGPVAAR
jgi:polyisoprenoid-binding protein YceI